MLEDPVASFEDNWKAAKAVYELAKDFYPHFHLLPFNRFEPHFTEWWIVPSNERPAYKFSKLCFHKRPRSQEGRLYVGYYVEKGLGQNLSVLTDVRKQHIMKSDWYWHQFIANAATGKIEATANELARTANVPVRILVEAYAFNRVVELDKERNAPDDSVEFIIQPPSLQWELIKGGEDVLKVINRCTSIASMMQKIGTAADLDYYWIDLVIGVRFCYGQEKMPGWSASDIWNKVLAIWLPFGLQQPDKQA